MKRQYSATNDSVGDWDGQETEIAARWNVKILPILEKRANALNPESDNYEVKKRELDDAYERAWTAFSESDGKIREAKKQATK